ncbi:MAG: hypothetical protein K8W52_35575, partial [Deltaproteobacteria bacterium]|nr:hypothetical protein [Deltaproteobacteria bacterium]
MAQPAVAIGTVLAVPLDDGRWTACQVVGAHEATPCIVHLRWVGDAPPALDALREVPALRIDHHSWPGQLAYHYVEAGPPPPELRVLGLAPVREVGECVAHGSWTGMGLQIGLQARWDALPEDVRRAYKEAPEGDEIELDLGSATSTVRLTTPRISVADGDAPTRWAELDRLPHLTELAYRGRDPAVLAYVRGRPLIGTLAWMAHGQRAIDVRGTNLRELAVEVTAPLTLTLPREVRQLRVSGDPSLLTCVQPGDGRALTLAINAPTGPLGVRGLPALRALEITNVATVEVAPLVAHPELARLELHGELVRVPDIAALAALRRLETLQLFHAYGIDAAAVPIAAQAWPALTRVSIDGYRKADA